MSDKPEPSPASLDGKIKTMDASTIGARAVGPIAAVTLRMATRIAKQRLVRLEHRVLATEHIRPLPEVGEAVHVVMNGYYSAWAIAGAIASLIPEPIDHMLVSTLGFHRENANDMIAMVDAGKVRSALLNVSTYFRSSDRDVFDFMKRAFVSRGQRVKVTRSHAKLMLFKTGSRSIVVEMSANLRSSQNWEQATIFNSAELLDFHRAWIDELHEAYKDDD